jgi:DNA polymerase III epsilon subunit-like protein
MMIGRPSTEEVISRLLDFIGRRPIVAHNASFDAKFFKSELNRIGKKHHSTFICSLKISRRLIGAEAKSHKLSMLKSFLKFSPREYDYVYRDRLQSRIEHIDHRALDDVLVTVTLWVELQRRLDAMYDKLTLAVRGTFGV